jgi:hypothetical protein
MVAIGRDGRVWQRVNRKERCPICGHDSWCGMIVGEVVACMRQADGAKSSKPGKDGQIRHYHDWPDRAVPIPIRPQPERPTDWTAPAASTCRALYTAIAARYAGRPRSKACAAEGDRRFGDRALDALAAADSFEVDERDLLAWLEAEGRVADAKSAGILGEDGKLAAALKGRKVYAFRLPDGTVANLRGRDLTGRSPLKVLDLAGGYEERGADAGLYHAERVSDVADGAGWLHLAGGCEKADALIAAGFSAVSTPGEGTLFDAALADLTARRVLSVAVWVDAEEPKEGEALSAGRRLGLAVAERLAAAGISVRVVEPAREPGSPKRDADGILRDGGPGALWDCWAASEDLAAFRARVCPDFEAMGRDPQLVDSLAAVQRERDEWRDRATRYWDELVQARELLALPDKHLGRTTLALSWEMDERAEHGETKRDPKTGQLFIHVNNSAAGRRVNHSEELVIRDTQRLVDAGLAEIRHEPVALEKIDAETGEKRTEWGKKKYLALRGASTIPEWRQKVVGAFRDIPSNHGGRRSPRPACPEHPEAGTISRTTIHCAVADCDQALAPPTEVYYDAEGNRGERPASGDGGGVFGAAGRYPQVVDDVPAPSNPGAGVYRDTFSYEDGLPTNLEEWKGSELGNPNCPAEPRTVRCLSAGRGCPNRVPPHLDYCPDCEAAGWHNHRAVR